MNKQKSTRVSSAQLLAEIEALRAEVEALKSAPKSSGNTGGKGIGKRVYEILADDQYAHLTYKEIAAKVSNEIGCNTTAGCVSWYVSHKADNGGHVIVPRKR